MKKFFCSKFLLPTIILVALYSCKENGPENYRNAVIALEPASLTVSQWEVSFDTPFAQSALLNLISTNVEWVITDIPDWITVDPASGVENSMVTVSVKENTSSKNRVGLLRVKSINDDWNFSKVLPVVQGRAKFYAIPEKNSLELDGSAFTEKIAVQSNYDGWTVKAGESLTWCAVTRNGNDIDIDSDYNIGGVSRSGQIVVSTPDGDEYVTITQRPAKIICTLDSVDFSVEGGYKSITVSSEAPWTAGTSYSWLKVTPESGTAGNTNVMIEVVPNTTMDNRKGYAYLVLSGDNKIELPVCQEGIIFSVDKTLIEAPVAGIEQTLTISSNVSWRFDENIIPSWMSVEPQSGIGDGLIKVKISANPGIDVRSALINVSPMSINNPTAIAVNQNGHLFETDSTIIYFMSPAGSTYFNILSDGSWTVLSSAPWITLDKESGTANEHIKVSVTENVSDTVRSGFIMAFVEGKQIKVAVYQQSKYIKVSLNALDYTSLGGSSIISFKTIYDWIAVSSDDWIQLSMNEGTGDCNLTVTVADNPSAFRREGEIVITPNGHNPVHINVNQDARYLMIPVDTIQFFYKGGASDPITFTTDGEADVTVDSDWLTIQKETDKQFIINVAQNDSDSKRSAKVIVSLKDLSSGTISKEIVIVQGYNDPFNGYDYVDLGLSVRWATRNVGASEPEDLGDYFAWGETSSKQTYTWANYVFYVGEWNMGQFSLHAKNKVFKKYNDNFYTSTWLVSDNLNYLQPVDDAAAVAWSSVWRMPTKAQVNELINKCDWTWTSLNGVKGYRVSKKGDANTSIFLPATGKFDEGSIIGTNTCGVYWTNQINEGINNPVDTYEKDRSHVLFFNDSKSIKVSTMFRYQACTVRPVTTATK